MSEDRKPRIDTVTGTYYRKGKCAVCSGSAERTKSFSGDTMETVEAKAERWMKDPITHKRCE